MLINELIKVNRFEEARQQLILLNKNNSGKYSFNSLEEEIKDKLEQYLNTRIEKTKLQVKLNPGDRKSVLEFSQLLYY